MQNNPRLLISQAKRVFLSGLLYAAALSAVSNLLQLTMPLFMLQVHDRVLNSQSMDTLVMLTILAIGALWCSVFSNSSAPSLSRPWWRARAPI